MPDLPASDLPVEATPIKGPPPFESGAPSVNGFPYTREDVERNPYLRSGWTQMLARDEKQRADLAKAVGPALERLGEHGIVANRKQFDQYLQLTAGDKEETARREKIVVTDTALRAQAGDPEAQRELQALAGTDESTHGTQLLEAAATRAATLPDITQQMHAVTLQDAAKRSREAINEDAPGYAARLYGIPAPQPIDTKQPDSIVAGMAHRALLAQKLGANDDSIAPSVFSKNERKEVGQAMTHGPAAAGTAVLAGLSHLRGNAETQSDPVARMRLEKLYDATMDGTELKNGVKAMAMSGDVAKMSAAYAFLDLEYQYKPMAFDADWGGDALKDLVAWKERLSMLPAEQVAKIMEKRADPTTKVRHAEMDKMADEVLLKNVKPDDVADYLVGWRGWVPLDTAYRPASDDTHGLRGELLNDYRLAYKDFYGTEGDANGAHKYALERLGNKWSISPANGGRLMPFAPEKSDLYPGIGDNKSKRWIADQAKSDVTQAILRSTIDPAERQRRMDMNFVLVSDAKTQSEFSSRKLPSYGIVVLDENNRPAVLTELDGVPVRFVADPELALAENRGQAQQERAWTQEIRGSSGRRHPIAEGLHSLFGGR